MTAIEESDTAMDVEVTPEQKQAEERRILNEGMHPFFHSQIIRNFTTNL